MGAIKSKVLGGHKAVNIIGLGHRKGVGKDTLAEMLANEYRYSGGDVLVSSFANNLKHQARELFGTYGLHVGEYYEDHREEKERNLEGYNFSPRDIYIKFGLFMRSFNEDHWVNAVLNDPHNHMYSHLIIPDVRFPNEARLIKEAGGTLIKVINPCIEDTDDAADCALKDYEGWDIQVVNDGTLEDLQENAECTIKIIGG